MAEAIIKTGNAKVYFDKNNNLVVMEWNGYSTSPQFKKGVELMLKTLIEQKTFKVLSDVKDMTMIGMKDQEWLNNDFLPRAIQCGLRMVALINPDSHFAKAALENVASKVNKNELEIRSFDSHEEAMFWLNSL